MNVKRENDACLLSIIFSFKEFELCNCSINMWFLNGILPPGLSGLSGILLPFLPSAREYFYTNRLNLDFFL